MDQRHNLDVANANGNIMEPSSNVQLHPMMTIHGRLPLDFSKPRRLSDFLYMSESELGSILAAYDIGPGRRQPHFRDRLSDAFQMGDPFRGSKKSRLRILISLFQYLGAHRLAYHLRHRG